MSARKRCREPTIVLLSAEAKSEGKPGTVPANPTLNFTRKASAYMTRQSSPAVVDTKSKEVIAKPGHTKSEVQIDLGGILVFKNEFSEMPDFAIEFVESCPPGADGPLTGTTKSPIAVQMPYDDLTFTYYICYKKHGRTPVLREGPFKVRSCPGCR